MSLRLWANDPHRLRRVRAAGRESRPVPAAGDAATKIRVPLLPAGRGAVACARTCRARRAAHRAVPLRAGRGKEHPLKVLAGYQGRFPQCDAYQSYNALTEIVRDGGPWQLVYCWTHVRRRFVKRFENDGSPIAEEMPRQIALLYQVEKSVRGKDPAVRLAARCEHAAPIVAALKPWLEAQLSHIPPKIPAGRGHPLHLGAPARSDQIPQRRRRRDGHQSSRKPDPPDCPFEKTALFAGNEVGAENWAMLASLVATCKMADVNPVDYIAATLCAILDGHRKAVSKNGCLGASIGR